MINRLLWPGMLFVLIGSSVIVHVIMLFVAANDPSFSVDADHHRDAAAWREHRAQQRANELLGWSLTVRLLEHPAPGRPARFELELQDAGGQPMTDATATVRAFHHARAANVLEATLDRVEDSETTAADRRFELPIRRSGYWEFEVTVRCGDERFVETVEKIIVYDAEGEKP